MDAVVVGAGVAGLAAAQRLTRGGATVVIVEAQDRSGGRILTAHDDHAPVPIELGAEFVDVPGPAYDAIRATGSTVYSSVGGMWNVCDGVAQAVDMNGAAERVLGRLERPPDDDQPFREWLAGQHGVSERDAEMVLRYVEGFHAADLDRVGIHWLSRTIQDSAGGGGEQRHHALHGFDRTPAGLSASLAPTCELRLNTIATEIVWSRHGVEVRCRSSSGASLEPLRATHAIITLPLGVLQSGRVRFTPPIDATIDAAHALALSSVLKVVFLCREPFWHEVIEFMNGDARERKFLIGDAPFPTWWTTSPVVSPVLTAWVGGSAVRHVRGLGDPVRVAIDSLATMTGVRRDQIEQQRVATWFHDWDADPFAGSAYSYAPAGALHAIDRLRAPIDDTLFFAGEAVAKAGWNGTVDGAIESGWRAADEMLGHG